MRIPSIPGFDPQAFEKYLKNTGWLMLAKVGSQVVKMVVATFVLSAYLGKDGNGVLNYPMSIVIFFNAIAALGLDGFVTRELLKRPEEEDKILGTAFRMRLVAGVCTLPLVWLAYLVMGSYKPQSAPLSYVIVVGFTSVIQAINIIDSYFQAQVRGKKIMYVQVSGNIISAVIKLVLILLRLPLVWFIYSLVLDALIIAIGYAITYLKDKRISAWKYNRDEALYLFKNAWPLTFSALLVSIYMKIDQLMISWYRPIGDLGIYSVVAGLSESWYFFPTAIVASVFPSIMYARSTDKVRYQKRLQNMYDLMVVSSVGIAIFITFASKYIFQIAYHKHPEYWSGAPVLSVHVWAGVFVFLGSASGQYLIAEGYNRLILIKTAAGAVANILLNIIWIPMFGIMGAAYATLVAYGISVFFILLVPKTRQQGWMMLQSVFFISLLRQLKRK